jgi:hypothetical protein
LPGWQALHNEIEALGATVVTVALDIDSALAKPWNDLVNPTHPSLVDTLHITNSLFGFTNIPMAAWIDEDGVLVRPAEGASIERSPLRDMEIPEGLPEQLSKMMHAVKAIPDDAEAYREAILDWVRNGSSSHFALTPDEVIARSQPRSDNEARATACFELGEYFHRQNNSDAAVQWWKEAHRLHPQNLTYKRQAWTLVTTPAGATEYDLMQGPNEVYDSNLVDEVTGDGGFGQFIIRPIL